MAGETFVDFYELLEISQNAQPDTVNRVYRLLAQRYHPDNQETGDAAKFGLIFDAHRVLSDPQLRAAYDVQYQQRKEQRWKLYDAKSAAGGQQSEREVRFGILGLLYTKRRGDPYNPNVPMYEMESLLGIPREHLEFSLWYLKEKKLLQRTDDSAFTITAEGVEWLEQNNVGERFQSALRLGVGKGTSAPAAPSGPFLPPGGKH
jgi:curved DNA-binding protein CbpA